MNNRGKFFWGAGAVLLVLLFLASSTDLIIKEKEVEVYPISVIISDNSDGYYGNFKRGLDKAVEDFHADVSMITLYEENSQTGQMELVRREIEDGARALILEPVNKDQALLELKKNVPSCPVIFMGAQDSAGVTAGSVRPDSLKEGTLLGQAAAAQIPSQTLICIFTKGLAYGDNEDIYLGIREVLEEKGYRLRLCQGWDTDTYRQALEETLETENEIAVIATDPKAFEEAIEIVDEDAAYQQQITGIYGVGATPSILQALESGQVDGIVAWNQFDQGYLSVYYAVEAIKGVWEQKQIVLEPYYLEAEDLSSTEYEKMLYPIE